MSATIRIVVREQPACVGDEFVADVIVDASPAINAGQGALSFDASALTLVRIEYGGSIFRYWQTQPSGSGRGEIAFVGGVPYPGYEGDGGKVFSAVFRKNAEAATTLSVRRDSLLLLNDGKGTPAAVIFSDATVRAGTQETGSCTGGTLPEAVLRDTTAPEPFDIVIARDDKIFGGRHFAAFETTDSGTGVAYYEIRETSPYLTTAFARVMSPYELQVQGGPVSVVVRAVDGAGNTREAQVTANLTSVPSVGMGLTLIVFAGAVMWFAIVWCRRKEK